jgi:hypothetical protein
MVPGADQRSARFPATTYLSRSEAMSLLLCLAATVIDGLSILVESGTAAFEYVLVETFARVQLGRRVSARNSRSEATRALGRGLSVS